MRTRRQGDVLIQKQRRQRIGGALQQNVRCARNAKQDAARCEHAKGPAHAPAVTSAPELESLAGAPCTGDVEDRSWTAAGAPNNIRGAGLTRRERYQRAENFHLHEQSAQVLLTEIDTG